jgi:thiol-disulfide isomerase/thioredoxin
MLLFTDPNCGPCTALLPEIGRWQQEHAEKLTISLISRGDPEENRAKSQEHGLQHVLLQKDWEVSEAYEASGTPSALLVRPDAKIGSPVSGGAEAIRSLLSYALGERSQLPMQAQAPQVQAPQAQAPQTQGKPCPNCGKVHPTAGHNDDVQQPMPPAGPKVGESAPEVKLEDLKGNTVELKDLSGGKETLVLFWNPGCGFCEQMLPDLKAWEANPPKGAPKLVVISAGTREANKEMGLSSPVLLDQQFDTGRAFGASGTPSAVLIDREGKLASEVAVGAQAVFALAGASPTTRA